MVWSRSERVSSNLNFKAESTPGQPDVNGWARCRSARSVQLRTRKSIVHIAMEARSSRSLVEGSQRRRRHGERAPRTWGRRLHREATDEPEPPRVSIT